MEEISKEKTKLLKDPIIKGLIKTGRKNGSLSYSAINTALPEGLEIEEMDNILMLFSDLKIPLIDLEGSDEEQKHKEVESLNNGDKEDKIPDAIEDKDSTDYNRYLQDLGKLTLASKEEELKILDKIVKSKESINEIIYGSELGLDVIFNILNKESNILKLYDIKDENDIKDNDVIYKSLEAKHNSIKKTLKDIKESIKESVKESVKKDYDKSNLIQKLKKLLKTLNLSSIAQERIKKDFKESSYIKLSKISKMVAKLSFNYNNIDSILNLKSNLGTKDKAKIIILDNVHKILVLEKTIEEQKHKLVKANLRLVVSIAKRYKLSGVNFFDLIQEGNVGLLKAVDRCKYTPENKFSTYATCWIKQAITSSIAYQKRLIKIPTHINDKIKKFSKATGQLLQLLGKEPSFEDLSITLNWSIEEVKKIHYIAMEPISLETKISQDNKESSLLSILEDKTHPPTDYEMGIYMLRNEIEGMLKSLSAKEKEVIKRRFGLLDGNPCTLREAGKIFNLTRERIRQIERKALKQLRASTPKDATIADYLY